MAEKVPYKLRIKFPGDLEYIPAVRKFVSEMLLVSQFSPKFAFRSEIIVDEICNNAVTYGCSSLDASVEVVCMVHDDRIEFQVKDGGGAAEDVKRLRDAVAAEKAAAEVMDGKRSAAGLGLEIVRLLSEEVNLEVDDNNLTSIRVVRKREDAAGAHRKSVK
jgi:anti-sigma regulatory factor (Ser/Thr protein kinase)